MAETQPFAGEPRAVVVLPERDPALGGEVRLPEIERAGFEAELGAPVDVTATDPGSVHEGFLLGLQGLEHVMVIGGRTGGGSEERTLPLLQGMAMTITPALTYDRRGRCIEGAGIPVDVEVSGTDEEVLAAARAL